MHHKFAIIDGAQTGEPSRETILITGSANWSSSAFTIYDEDWLRYDGNYKLMRAYNDKFAALWELGSGSYESLLDSVQQADGQGPCNFSPLSLTPERLQRLRDQFTDGACHF